MREKLKELMDSGWMSVYLTLFGAAVNIFAAIWFPGPIGWLNWMLAGIGLGTAFWVYQLYESCRSYESIISMQSKMMDEMASTFAQHAQSSHQTFKSSIQKFMEDQDDKPVNPNGPKVH